MALQELNRTKDLAREWGVCPETIRRWVKIYGLRVKRPSERTIIIPKREAEKLWRRIDAQWGPVTV